MAIWSLFHLHGCCSHRYHALDKCYKSLQLQKGFRIRIAPAIGESKGTVTQHSCSIARNYENGWSWCCRLLICASIHSPTSSMWLLLQKQGSKDDFTLWLMLSFCLLNTCYQVLSQLQMTKSISYCLLRTYVFYMFVTNSSQATIPWWFGSWGEKHPTTYTTIKFHSANFLFNFCGSAFHERNDLQK